MGSEIERKFLVAGDGWRDAAGEGRAISQGYIPSPAAQIRIRLLPDGGWLTFKSGAAGLVRREFEYPIPRSDGEELLALFTDGMTVEKTRFPVLFAGKTWEVDTFHGKNAGLVVAEIELGDPSEGFERPPWIGAEVTGDARFGNANLAVRPWGSWSSPKDRRP
jgi:adenylate cyclase